MAEDIPDAALAQALLILRDIRPVAIACIGGQALAIFLSLAVFGDIGNVVHLFASGTITAIVGFTAMRSFLSGGRAAILSPIDCFRERRFGTYLQLSLIVTIASEISWRLLDAGGSLGLVGGFGAVATLIALASYGTVFPAIVEGGDTSLDAARGRHAIGALFWRLLAAEGLALVLISGPVLLAGMALQDSVDSTVGLAVMAPIMAAISVFITVLIAVILAKAYQGRYSP